MDQLLNSPTLIDRLQSEERIKDANCDTESWFIHPKTLGFFRFAFTLLTIAFITITLIQNRALYFNELYGWNWLAILIYFTLGTMKSYAYLSESTANVITLPTVFDILFISTSSISVLLLVCYWLFIPIESAIIISTNPLRFIGYNIGIIVLFIETIVSRVAIVKHYAALVPVFVLLYVFFTWITHDKLNWPFALGAIEKYLSNRVNPYHLTIYFLVLLAVSSIPSVLVYLVISVRDALGSRVNSKKPSSDKA